MSSFRHLSRIVAMQTLFEFTIRQNAIEKILKYNTTILSRKITDTSFLEKLVFGILEKRTEIDTILVKYAPDWPLEKLPLIERIVLELGIFELLFLQDSPVPVILNETVEIAKTYGDENSHKFINGVLSSISKKEIPIS